MVAKQEHLCLYAPPKVDMRYNLVIMKVVGNHHEKMLEISMAKHIGNFNASVEIGGFKARC